MKKAAEFYLDILTEDENGKPVSSQLQTGYNFMDEPTVAVDPQSRNKILEGIEELNAKGATIIYTSHYMEEVEAICTRIAIMDNGKIIACGTSEELKKLVNDGDENITLEEVFLTLTGKKLRDYAE